MTFFTNGRFTTLRFFCIKKHSKLKHLQCQINVFEQPKYLQLEGCNVICICLTKTHQQPQPLLVLYDLSELSQTSLSNTYVASFVKPRNTAGLLFLWRGTKSKNRSKKEQ